MSVDKVVDPAKIQGDAAPRRSGIRPYQEVLVVFIGYFLVAWLFYAAGLDLTHILIGGGDGLTSGLPSKLFANHLRAWNPYVQLGEFSFAFTHYQSFYPPSIILMAIFPNTFGYNMYLLAHYGLAGASMYFFAKHLRLQTVPSLAGGLIFMCGGIFAGQRGEQAIIGTAAWLPFMLLFLSRYAETVRMRYLTAASVVLAMSVFAGFPQITLYSLMLAAPYTLFRIKQRDTQWRTALTKSAFALGITGILAFLLSSLQLFSILEVLPFLTRSKLTYAMFSDDYFPWYHLPTLLFPNLLGGTQHIRIYSPENYINEVFCYVGLMALALAFLALLSDRRASTNTLFWGATAVAALAVALGRQTPLSSLLFHVPVYNLFRAPARHLLEVHFALAVLAAIGLDLVWNSNSSWEKSLPRKVRAAGWILCALVAISYGFVPALLWMSGHAASAPKSLSALAQMLADRADVVKQNLGSWTHAAGLPLLFLALTLVCLGLIAARRWRRLWSICVPLLVVADLYAGSYAMYRNPDASALGRPEANPVTAMLAAQHFDSQMYRVFSAENIGYTAPLVNMMYRWSVVNDYSPYWLKRYVALTDFDLNGLMTPQNLLSPNLLTAAATRYVIAMEGSYADYVAAAEWLRPEESTPISPTGDAELAAAQALGDGAYRLQSDGIAVSLVQFPIPLQKSTNYRISFTANAPSGVTSSLIMNLNAPGYADRPLWRVFSQLPTDSERLALTIDSGPSAPEQGYVRFLTQSTAPIEIADVKIEAFPAAHADPQLKAYRRIYTGDDGVSIFENRRAVPRFRFVRSVRPSKDVFDARRVLYNDPSFDSTEEALVEGFPERSPMAPGRILASDIQDTSMEWTVETGDRGFFVVADSWMPEWRAAVDGKAAPIWIVDGCLRGVAIEGAGRHRVTMSFHPWSVPVGIGTTLLGLVLVAFLWWRY